MIDPNVTAWCPRGDHDRCFGGADGVVFGAAPSFGKGWHPAGHHPVAGAGSSWLATRAGARVVTMPDAKAASGWLMDN
jgi:hypothetical protein